MINISELFKKFLSSFQFHPWMHTIVLFVLTSTLTIIFSLTLFLKNLESILVSWGSQIEMNIYLKDNLKQDQQNEIQKKIVELGYFKDVKYVTKEKAIENFFTKMSRYVPDFSEDKEFLNVIPSSYFATLDKNLPLSKVTSIAAKILNISGIEDVSYGQEWIQNFSIFLSSLKHTSFSISFVLVLGGLLVIGFIIYILIQRRREEIEIYELCGATSSMIQAPFLFEGGILCFLSSISALGFSYILLQFQNGFLHTEMVYFGLTDIFRFFTWSEVVFSIALSVFVGVGVSYLCIRKLNTGWAAASRL